MVLFGDLTTLDAFQLVLFLFFDSDMGGIKIRQ
jgi:hypothetical protein